MNIFLIIIAIFSSIIAGMGVGGGSIFILLSTIFNLISHKEAIVYNLVMFVVTGISASITNLKNKSLDVELFKKLIIPVCLGSIIGVIISKNINENYLKNLFYGFMISLGSYEIISSLKNIIKTNTKINR